MTCKFKAGETYRTRDGREARVYATDGGGLRPIHGAVRDTRGVWLAQEWSEDGRHALEILDLMPPKREVWVAVYDHLPANCTNILTLHFASRERAEQYAASNGRRRIAVLGPVEIEDAS